MNLEPNQSLHGFSVKSCEDVPEIDGQAYILTHEVSGTKLLYLKNNDANKAFSIAFKTPPANDTGVFHILEHSVLCGSRKFPVKEPFVNLLKTSMQTFLNAMTFPDKTVYPVASTNERDLMNLVDVYLDAVFHPQIYNKRAIFEQEGWHYELASDAEGGSTFAGQAELLSQLESLFASGNAPISEEDLMQLLSGPAAPQSEEELVSLLGNILADAGVDLGAGNEDTTSASTEAATEESTPLLAINGVVYNEMKGALSEPSSVLFDELQAALFPENAYRFESGGLPKAIPTLSYEHFLEEHARHYNTHNSYITLYGNLDIERMLEFLDTQYLSPVEEEQRAREKERKSQGLPALLPNELNMQKPVKSLSLVREMNTSPENSCMGIAYVIGTAHDRTRLVALDILLDAIMGSNEAPLKRCLLDASIANEAQAFLADSMLQPFVVFQLRGLKNDAQSRFRVLIESELKKFAEGALDHELISAALTHAEFVMREREFGIADGVALSLSALAGWLYDDDLSLAYIRYEDTFAYLRKALDEGYFEQLIKQVFLESEHMAELELRPTSCADDFETQHLLELEKSITPDDLEEIAQNVARLRALQEATDSAEALKCLPQLSLDDLDEAPKEPTFKLLQNTPVPCLYHQVATHGIAYSYRYFSLEDIPFEELPYVSILCMLLGKLHTNAHSAAEIDTLIQGELGNLGIFCEVYENAKVANDFLPVITISSSALSEKVPSLSSLVDEVLRKSLFDDAQKIKDVLVQKRVAMEQSFANAGHSCAMARASSYCMPAALVRENLGGVDFYFFLKELIEAYDERASELANKLKSLSEQVFRKENMLVSFSGNEQDFKRFWEGEAALEDNTKLEGAKVGANAAEGDAKLEGATTPEYAQSSKFPLNTQARKPYKTPEPTPKNEAFIVSSNVVYAACASNFKANVSETSKMTGTNSSPETSSTSSANSTTDNFPETRNTSTTSPSSHATTTPYSGAWMVAARALSFDYLWNEVRVKGGAYGAGFQVARSGSMRFYSYRDPHLSETLERFKGAGDWLFNFNPTKEELEGYIISTLAGIDAPLKPRALARKQDGRFFANLTEKEREQTRKEVIECSKDDLHKLAQIVKDSPKAGNICVFGNEDIIKNSSAELTCIKLLDD